MRMDNYLSVCMFQLKVQLDCNSQDEYIIETEELSRQIEKAFGTKNFQSQELLLQEAITKGELTQQ